MELVANMSLMANISGGSCQKRSNIFKKNYDSEI